MEVNLPFLLCFTLYLRHFSKYKPPGSLYLCYRFGGLYLEGLIHRGLISEFYGIILILFVVFQLVVVPVTDAVVSACRVFPVRH